GLSYTGDGISNWGLSGAAGNDTFIAHAGAAAFIDGGSGTNTLIGPDQTNTWALTDVNLGTLNADTPSVILFARVQDLTCGCGDDTFDVQDGASLSGLLSGRQGLNTLDDTDLGQNVTVDLQRHVATGVGRFEGLQRFVGAAGQSNTLRGANKSTTWLISAA